MGPPSDSEALGLLIEMPNDEYFVPEWHNHNERLRLQNLKNTGSPVHVGKLQWGVCGPHGITHYLHITDEAKYAYPKEALYPVRFRNRRYLLRSGLSNRVEKTLSENTYSIHFCGRRVTEFLSRRGGSPQPNSYLEMLLQKHGIDPADAPIS
ncbi:hypothetical protein [Ruegeria conchae]|uniref:hypothetical protein n=1 Tax=Ruegeria conchae TaxID=981384 RepID=UPI0029C73985|nr:hypothetical protein [Ruegeria conchae]